MKIKAFIPIIILFSLVSAAEIWGEELYQSTNDPTLLFLTKPLIMPVLMAFLWINTKLKTKFDKFIFVGFILGWIGDMLLMVKNDDLFVFGLASFLLCHIFYIAAFVGNIRKSGHQLSLINRIILGLLPLFYLIVLYSYIYPHIVGNEASKPFLIPVTVYAITIVTMVLFALWRIGSTNKLSAVLIILGAFTFIISDSLIAINKFVKPFEHANLFIMLTYCIAQLWIATGSIQHHQKLKA